jgi:hypothetical protein
MKIKKIDDIFRETYKGNGENYSPEKWAQFETLLADRKRPFLARNWKWIAVALPILLVTTCFLFMKSPFKDAVSQKDHGSPMQEKFSVEQNQVQPTNVPEQHTKEISAEPPVSAEKSVRQVEPLYTKDPEPEEAPEILIKERENTTNAEKKWSFESASYLSGIGLKQISSADWRRTNIDKKPLSSPSTKNGSFYLMPHVGINNKTDVNRGLWQSQNAMFSGKNVGVDLLYKRRFIGFRTGLGLIGKTHSFSLSRSKQEFSFDTSYYMVTRQHVLRLNGEYAGLVETKVDSTLTSEYTEVICESCEQNIMYISLPLLVQMQYHHNNLELYSLIGIQNRIKVRARGSLPDPDSENGLRPLRSDEVKLWAGDLRFGAGLTVRILPSWSVYAEFNHLRSLSSIYENEVLRMNQNNYSFGLVMSL